MTVLDLDTINRPERRPGDFHRHPTSGAPYVTHPTDTSKPTGTKNELIDQCKAAGVDLPQKITVPVLQELLRRPKRVTYGRPSGLGKQIENLTNLQKWSERMVALGLTSNTDLYHEALDLADLDQNTPEFKQLADTVAVKAKNAAQAHLAAERGTHHHELTEDLDNDRDPVARMAAGETLGVPRHVQHALLDAWAAMLATFDLEILATEATVVDDTWCQAGTLDRHARLGRDLRFVLPDGEIVTLPAGTIIVLDIKTGRLRVDERTGLVAFWLAYAVQLASYAQAVPYNTDTDQRGDWGYDVDQRWAVIAHLDILAALNGEAVCRLILVDLEAGRHAGDLCVAARAWEKRTDVFSVPSDEMAVRVQVTAPAEADIEPPADAAPVARREWLLARIDVVKARGLARELLAIWPEGVPGTATEHRHTNTELDLIHQAVDTIEKRHSLPLEPDPTVVAAKLEAVLDARRDRLASEPAAPVQVDEGDPLTDDEFDTLQTEIAAAEPAHHTLVNVWLTEAVKAGVGFSASRVRTTRRRAIIRAAFALADVCDGLESEADLAVAVLYRAVDFDPGDTPVGVTLGQLDEKQAVAVVEHADQIEHLALSYATGRPRLVDQIAS